MTAISRFLGSKFEHCDDSCGWTAAIIAALAYGTFGVPVKETVSIDVHPLVLQSYKTLTMFLLSWLVVFLGESVRFTPWGILSGTLWVLGGTGGIYGIRNAGMAIAVGTWSSIMILVNFLVGIVFFQEPVASFFSTCGAFLCLALGLVGMSIYSAPTASSSSSGAGTGGSSPSSLNGSEHGLLTAQQEESNHEEQEMTQVVSVPSHDRPMHVDSPVISRPSPARTRSLENLDNTTTNYDPLRDPAEAVEEDGIWRDRDKKERKFVLENYMKFTKRELGILGAVLNGVLTGSSLVPLHYAKKHGFGGAAYMISFASGALLSNIMIFIVWFVAKMVMSQRETSTSSGYHLLQTYESMPPWHLRQLYIPGFSAGLLLAIAMFGSIMSVTYLGQGVGNSIVQSKILISGLWGIFWYREIVVGLTIAKWFASAGLTVCGILWLSYERIHAKAVAEHHF